MHAIYATLLPDKSIRTDGDLPNQEITKYIVNVCRLTKYEGFKADSLHDAADVALNSMDCTGLSKV